MPPISAHMRLPEHRVRVGHDSTNTGPCTSYRLLPSRFFLWPSGADPSVWRPSLDLCSFPWVPER